METIINSLLKKLYLISAIISLIITISTYMFVTSKYVLDSQFSISPTATKIASFIAYYIGIYGFLHIFLERDKAYKLGDKLFTIYISIMAITIGYFFITANTQSIIGNKIYCSSLFTIKEYSMENIDTISFSDFYDGEGYTLHISLQFDGKNLDVTNLKNNTNLPDKEALKELYTNIKTNTPNVTTINNMEDNITNIINDMKFISNGDIQ